MGIENGVADRHTRGVPDDILTPREQLIIQLHYSDGWSERRIARGIADIDSPASEEERRYLHATEVKVWRDHKRALAVLRAYCKTGEGPFDVLDVALAPEDSRG